MNWPARVALLFLLLLVLTPLTPSAQSAARASFPPAEVPPRNDIRLDNRVGIPMRDGVILYADVYRPVDEGRYPVLVSRTPYSTERFPSAYDAGVYFSRRGYVYVFQDVRGRHESDGRWEPFFDDEKDGYDTIEWAAKQRWSNGKVGMEGGSYLGQNQWRAAQAAPASLVTIFPSVASTSIYHDWITLNGAWRLSFNFGWGPVRQESRIMQNPGPHTENGLHAIHYDEVQKHLLDLSLVRVHEALRRERCLHFDLFRHELAAYQCEDVMHGVGPFEDRAGRVLAPQHRAQRAHYFAGLAIRRHDIGQNVAHFLRAEQPVVEETQAGLCIVQDGRQRLRELVRERRNEQRRLRDAGGMPFVRAQLPHLLLGVAQRADILDGCKQALRSLSGKHHLVPLLDRARFTARREDAVA